jgi:fructosamine-3-kinase
LVTKSYDLGLLKDAHLSNFDLLFKRIDELIPLEKPSLLHGDLWSGNIICGPQQKAYFIDPAAYFGHREVDIAMSFLFGGFDFKYLSAYQEIYPLEPDWNSRIELHNLYPRLVHLVLFGSSYLEGIEKILLKF